MISEGVITACTFDKEWTNPKDDKVLYYHRLEFLNGDKGNVGTADKMPEKIKVGTTVYYTLNENRIKLFTKNDFDSQDGSASKPASKPQSNGGQDKPKKAYQKNPQDAITFIMGYASNRHVAKITSLKKDIPLKEMLDDADKIYAHYQKMLSQTTSNNA